MVFWGPPGSGKTTLAELVSNLTRCRFRRISAVQAGVKQIREEAESAILELSMRDRRTIIFIDEIHRFNKSQQDALLPFVEDGALILIGATTENPSFEINAALLSRVKVYHLEPLRIEDLVSVLSRAQTISSEPYRLDLDALSLLGESAGGDARTAINRLEAVMLHFRAAGRSLENFRVSKEETLAALKSLSIHSSIRYDKSGEEHYDVISAFIKSIRDSDPDGGLYYLARMLEGGEDPKFICRRLIVLASEDIGNADPRALQIAVAVKEAVHFIGMPEARINLAQAVTYLACAPKSNASYVGVERALAEVRRSGPLSVPKHLRNAVTGLMRKEGYGKGYQYAHDSKSGYISQAHLPDKISGQRFYEPKSIGYEGVFKERLDQRQPR